MKFLTNLLLSLFLGATIAHAQSLNVRGDIHLPKPPNMGGVFTEDLQMDRPGFPKRFALPYGITNRTLGQGQWYDAHDGTLLWKLTITADESDSLNIGFSQFNLPRSARLFVAHLDGSPALRPFTAWDNKRHGQLWTPPISGQGIQLQLVVAKNEARSVHLQIGVVNYGYRKARPFTESMSGSCNVDVVCNNDPKWRGPIQSVAAITVKGVDTCTGALVNNTAQDRRPYFLTANHCGIKSNNASSVVAIWNYQNSTCRQPGSAQSGQDGDGNRKQFNSGATFRASSAASDFTLIEFETPLDPAFHLFLAGWDHSGAESPNLTGIHHPSVADKRISFSSESSTTTSYLEKASPGDGTHIRVTKWTNGTTEPGSSGSPLFDANGRIIGQLHGGRAACNAPNDSDWYGRFSVSWAGGNTAETSLKAWLDPQNAGVQAIDGIPAN